MATATATAAESGPAGALLPRLFRVATRVQDTADTWTLALSPTSGEDVVVSPGQFMMVYVFGVGEVPISVSGPPNRPGAVILTVRDVGAVTHAICAAQPGAVLGLRGPFGNSWPNEVARGGDVLVVAGGIGLAPLRPVVLRSLEAASAYGSVTLLYGARSPADLLYPAQLEEWRKAIDVDVTVDTAGSGWDGHVGVVPRLIGDARFRPEAVTAFVCGPEIMMHFVVEELVERAVSPDRIHVSMERHMQCGVGLCGHCQLGPTLICRDGPVYSYAEAAPWLKTRQL